MSDKILEVKNITKYFPVRGGLFSKVKGLTKAVDDVSFHVNKGQTFGLVGESGCGKTTLAWCILRLINPTSGEIWFQGREITHVKGKELRKIRMEMSVVFQDPGASLNPRMTIKGVLSEPLVVKKIAKGEELENRLIDILQKVGMEAGHLWRYPHEYSGGQKQRIAIARALSLNPRLIVFDEPASALDVSVQASILNLLKDLQANLKLTYLLISHDIDVVKFMSDRIAVMYLGKIVEIAPTLQLTESPKHVYTMALIDAVPVLDTHVKKNKIILGGDVPSALNPPQGCRFHPRCSKAMSICEKSEPSLIAVEKGHLVACHLYD